MRLPTETPHTFNVQSRRQSSVKGEALVTLQKADPVISLSRWNARATLDIHYHGIRAEGRQVESHKIAWNGVEHSLHAYDVSPTSELDEGGLELEVILPSKPQVNFWSFTIPNWDRYDFDHQSALAHIDQDGSSWETNQWGGRRQRPAHVVNSYAVYARSIGGHVLGDLNFEIGKILHIFRPKVVDATGLWVWGTLNFKEGTLTVTAPWSFLEGATYPVRVDPTFGYSGTAASDDNIADVHLLLKAASNPASNGSLTSVTIKGRIKTDIDPSGIHPNHAPAIFSDSAGAPNANLASTDAVGSLYTGSDAEVTTNLAFASLVSGTQYWLGSRLGGAWTNSATIDAFFKFDASGGSNNLYFKSNGGVPVNWPSNSSGFSSASNEKVYIYGTHTSAGGGFLAKSLAAIQQAIMRSAVR